MIQPEIYHYGVPGMKWGKRKASSSTPTKNQTGSKDTPSLARAALVGGIGGFQKKTRYTDPAALKKREQAGKILTASIVTSLAGVAVSSLGANNANVALVGRLLSAAGSLGSTGAIATNISATMDERAARKNS